MNNFKKPTSFYWRSETYKTLKNMKWLIIIPILFIFSCNQKSGDKTPSQYLDSLKEAKKTDSLVANRMKEIYMDTTGIYQSPVKVVSFSVKQGVVTNDIQITYKNTSDKVIDAVKFRWYAEDAFAEPINFDMGEPGFGQGTDTQELQPGEERTSYWNGSDKLKRVKLAWPVQAVDHNGIKWNRKE